MLAHTNGMLLPDGFLFGATSSAHQTEGGNPNGVWRTADSGDAADSYHRWRVDMDLLAELGFTDYRFSIEWARIEPAPGRFSRAALAHYTRMVEGTLERGLRPLVTLHHFTVPRWFAERGGWHAPAAAELFARYAAETAPVLAAGVRHVCTINEPNTIATPLPDAVPDQAVTASLIEAHRRAVAALKAVSPGIQAGWSVAGLVCRPVPGAEAVAAGYRYPREDVFLAAAREDDWVGVQPYTLTRIGRRGPLPLPEGAERTADGREYYPPALGEALRHAARVAGPVPLIVTEHGLATWDDSRRIAYTLHALQGLSAALSDGLDIRGYLHGGALGTTGTTGLIAVDPDTFLRAPRPSARWLGRIARSRTLPWPDRHTVVAPALLPAQAG